MAVTANATYKAKYIATKRKYTITFVNGDGTRSTSTLEYGKVPTAPVAKLPGNNAQFSYSAVGWTPDIVAVTGNATYTLDYLATVNEYTVTFLNFDNTELQSSDVAYGEMPEYTGATPSRAASAQYTYTFTGWTPTLAAVTGKASYKAVFSQEAVVASSSSAVQSSNSEEESSSSTVIYSSDANGVIISGNLQQTVVKGGSFETVTISGVESWERSYEAYVYWLDFNQVGDNLVISQPTYHSTEWMDVGTQTQKFTVNGTQYEISVDIVAASAVSSSSVEESSASEMSSSAGGIVESSSAGQDPFLALRGMPQSRLSVSLSGRMLLIEGGQATVEVFDLQGRPLARFTQVSGAVELARFNSGSYILRIRSGTQVQNRKITLK